MSPADLSVLIRCYAIPGPLEDTPSVQGAIEQFLTVMVIEHTGRKGEYRCTAKGNAWMEMILNTPMPVPRWVDPRQDKNNSK